MRCASVRNASSVKCILIVSCLLTTPYFLSRAEAQHYSRSQSSEPENFRHVLLSMIVLSVYSSPTSKTCSMLLPLWLCCRPIRCHVEIIQSIVCAAQLIIHTTVLTPFLRLPCEVNTTMPHTAGRTNTSSVLIIVCIGYNMPTHCI